MGTGNGATVTGGVKSIRMSTKYMLTQLVTWSHFHCEESKELWDNLFAHCEDVPLPMASSDWFNKEMNAH